MSVSPPWWIPDHCDALRQAVGLDAVLSKPRIGRLPITRGRSSEVVNTSLANKAQSTISG